jgi:hypothetical protein
MLICKPTDINVDRMNAGPVYSAASLKARSTALIRV